MLESLTLHKLKPHPASRFGLQEFVYTTHVRCINVAGHLGALSIIVRGAVYVTDL